MTEEEIWGRKPTRKERAVLADRFAPSLRETMQLLGVRRKDMTDRFSHASVHNWLSGRSLPTASKLQDIAGFLEIEVSQLIEGVADSLGGQGDLLRQAEPATTAEVVPVLQEGPETGQPVERVPVERLIAAVRQNRAKSLQSLVSAELGNALALPPGNGAWAATMTQAIRGAELAFAASEKAVHQVAEEI